MSKGGRLPYDAVLMFKITMLQQWYGLSDMALEYRLMF
ncbi:MAG: transposase [Synergistaceae bacterium]|nr:transposase [Synergistaceae bacterium]